MTGQAGGGYDAQRGEAAASTYRLTEEQVLLRDTIRELADERIAPRAAEIDRTGEFPEDIRQLLAEHDVLALPFPEPSTAGSARTSSRSASPSSRSPAPA